MPLLKLDKHDPQKELEFDVKCALMMTPEDRLKKWLEWNIKMLNWVGKMHGYQTTAKIVKRI